MLLSVLHDACMQMEPFYVRDLRDDIVYRMYTRRRRVAFSDRFPALNDGNCHGIPAALPGCTTTKPEPGSAALSEAQLDQAALARKALACIATKRTTACPCLVNTTFETPPASIRRNGKGYKFTAENVALLLKAAMKDVSLGT